MDEPGLSKHRLLSQKFSSPMKHVSRSIGTTSGALTRRVGELELFWNLNADGQMNIATFVFEVHLKFFFEG
jgi:hypothetical protein